MCRTFIRALPASPKSRPSPWSKVLLNAATKSRPNGDPTSPLALSRPQPLQRLSATIGASKNNLHWALDVIFNEDRSRLRIGHGAMAVVRHFALNLVRQITDKRSIKRRRKCAAWDPKYLMEILGPLRR